ncbi:MAG: DUF6797 domain-containing protein [Isosphaeraceae bacterium]
MFASLLLLATWLPGMATEPLPPSLEAELRRIDPAELATEIERKGNPDRGALLFYQPHLACARCHVPGASSDRLGPDLSRESQGRTTAELVQSVLEPSRVVLKGYEPITVATTDGRTLTGLIAEERPDALVLRDPARDGQKVVIPRSDIDERKAGGPSIMPAGLVNLLANRQEFLDLLRYVREVSAFGPSRALELKPSPSSLKPLPLPAYEKSLDHAGLLGSLDAASLERGKKIYDRICVTCHGTKDRPGSMPTSLRFASGSFKNGSDPYSLYRTLTHGYGQMPAQRTLVPSEKYDVIHYIREAILARDNPSQHVALTPDYLARLPKGTERGPRPEVHEPWLRTDYGDVMALTVEVGERSGNLAHKGIAIRLDPGSGGIAAGHDWVVYDHDTLRIAGAWSGAGFIDWNGINFNGRHDVHPTSVGKVHFDTLDSPAWADPETGRFDDPRIVGRDQKRYGPLPRGWARYRGLYRHGSRAILSYDVGDCSVLDSPAGEKLGGDRLLVRRCLSLGRSRRDLALRVARTGTRVVAFSRVDAQGAVLRELADDEGWQVLRIPARETPLDLEVWLTDADATAFAERLRGATAPLSLEPLMQGGPAHWSQALKSRIEAGLDDGPFASDNLTPPERNPWNCQFRLAGLDFFDDGRRVAVCSWDGDVWIVEGIDQAEGELTWRRIASGLFQPLGLKLVDGQIYVTCRDQIVILRDRNGDGETDFYECFNSDHQVTEHFHEFAMDLQRDAEGNFYYAKGARHAKKALVPQHGTLLKVSADGRNTEILATGFRAPNGVCLNEDGSFFMSDQEGHWIPKNRINRVVRGGFYGNMWGFHDVTDPSDSAMEQPLCWITNVFDRSPAEQIWVTSENWGPLRGSLLNLSYGYGKLYVVPFETVDGQVQGGMCELPLAQFPTGVVRGRFHPKNGHLYLCGLFGWASNQEYPGGFYRVRTTGQPIYLPVGLHAAPDAFSITFSSPLDRSTATDVSNFAVRVWGLKRTTNYGSPHVDEHALRVAQVNLSDDGRTVTLKLPGLAPTRGMQVVYQLRGKSGELVEGRIHNTIHHLGR